MTAGAQRATLVPNPGSEEGVIQVLAVSAGDELYGFPLSSVREILMPPPLTEVPRAAEHFLGIISVRGEIVTLVDLPKRLDLDAREARPAGRILLVDNGDEVLGLAVDRVIRVAHLAPDQIEYASAMSAELSEYVVGIARIPSDSPSDESDLLIMIDPSALLGDLT
ncbi:MAG: chemotaxis protein CheW [Polyangiales bacterium]